ncbi:sigma-70 family RNA polymerase sigma factor [Streptomyces sp. Ac-502]|uniref:sigma-70 family RNA polymerase sigma factor n=1 Tax=Streptomyces sp. Ac-502 TaxID=3342801 RepID=UPI003862B47F
MGVGPDGQGEDRPDAVGQGPFAIPAITGELKRHFRDHPWDVHVPRRTQELRNKVRKAIREPSTALDGRPPTVAQIVEHACLTEEEVAREPEALENYRPLSLDVALDRSVHHDDYTLLDTLGAADDRFGLVENRETVKPALAKLPERERRILYWRFFKDVTQSAIAAELGLSQMHVSRLISRALARVRTEVEQHQAGQDTGREDRAAA